MQNPFAGARFLLSVAHPSQLPDGDRPELAFAGRSNAGKSSALNTLCSHKGLARVSKTPGRTQLLNFFELPQARLVDLPGYGFADVPQEVRRTWGPLITDYLKNRDNLRGIVLITDSRRPLTAFDRQMLEWAVEYHRPVHVLLSKSDKLASGAARQALREAQAQLEGVATVQLFSATRKLGVPEARARLLEWLDAGAADPVPGPA